MDTSDIRGEYPDSVKHVDDLKKVISRPPFPQDSSRTGTTDHETSAVNSFRERCNVSNATTASSDALDFSKETPRSISPIPRGLSRKTIYPHIPVKSDVWSEKEYREQFEFVVEQLKGAVDAHEILKDRARSIMYDLRMVGTTGQTATPSIVVWCCKDDVKQFRELFKGARTRIQAKNPSWFSRLFKKAVPQKAPFHFFYRPYEKELVKRLGAHENLSVKSYSDITLCGSLVRYRDKVATLGLTLEVDERDLQLTVDHLFDDGSADSFQSRDGTGSATSEDSDVGTLNDDDLITLNRFWIDDSEDEYVEDDTEDSPRIGELSARNEKLAEVPFDSVVSNPARLDAMEGQRVHGDTVQRLNNPLSHSPSESYLDWALIELRGQLHPKRCNFFYPKGPGTPPVLLETLCEVPRFHGVPVYLISGASGVRSGVMLGGFSYLGSRPGQELCKAWTMILDEGGLVAGDCGALVVDQGTFHVYGHVFGSNPLEHAFVAPLAHVIQQVKDRFGAHRVGLPQHAPPRKITNETLDEVQSMQSQELHTKEKHGGHDNATEPGTETTSDDGKVHSAPVSTFLAGLKSTSDARIHRTEPLTTQLHGQNARNPSDSKDELRRQVNGGKRAWLEKSLANPGYSFGTAVLLYWAEGDPGFLLESDQLGSFLRDRLGYEIKSYAIPRQNPQIGLHLFLLSVLMETNERIERGSPGLLLIYYGGYGDRNCNGYPEEQGEFVWAERPTGGPTLDWFRIQSCFREAKADILFLFDASFSLRADRVKLSQNQFNATPDRSIQMLAAAGEDGRCPMPGAYSFTQALLKGLDQQFPLGHDTSHAITPIQLLRGMQNHRHLKTDPVFFIFTQGTIWIAPLKGTRRLVSEEALPQDTFRIQIATNGPQADGEGYTTQTQAIQRWLTLDRPRCIADIKLLAEPSASGCDTLQGEPDTDVANIKLLDNSSASGRDVVLKTPESRPAVNLDSGTSTLNPDVDSDVDSRDNSAGCNTLGGSAVDVPPMSFGGQGTKDLSANVGMVSSGHYDRTTDPDVCIHYSGPGSRQCEDKSASAKEGKWSGIMSRFRMGKLGSFRQRAGKKRSISEEDNMCMSGQ